MVLKILKKKKVPDELPELVSDQISKKSEKEETQEVKPTHQVVTETKTVAPVMIKEERPGTKIEKKEEKIELVDFPDKETKIQENDSVKKVKPDSGFFNDLEKYLTKEIGDLDQLENWYNNKFSSRDVVSDMKTYWEKQKNSSAINLLSKNFQEKILERTEKLQFLEKEWQEIYFQKLEKESEIRENEKELKKMLSDFVEVCKKRENRQEIARKIDDEGVITLGENNDKIIRIM